jgi:hypothetical protein
MAISGASLDYKTRIAALSLIAGPLLMAIGDLIHPEERMAPAEQVVIVVAHASRWVTAHLLLFIGILLFIPGFLALAALTQVRKPAVGYAARLLTMIGVAGFASILVWEMLVGRLALDGVHTAAATALLENMLSGPVMAAVGPAMLAFVVGTALFAIPLMRAGGALGWAAGLILLGLLFVVAEILSAQVILSQIGNVVIFCGSATAAWLILRGSAGPITAA